MNYERIGIGKCGERTVKRQEQRIEKSNNKNNNRKMVLPAKLQ